MQLQQEACASTPFSSSPPFPQGEKNWKDWFAPTRQPPSLSDRSGEHENGDAGGARRFCVGAGGRGAWEARHEDGLCRQRQPGVRVLRLFGASLPEESCTVCSEIHKENMSAPSVLGLNAQMFQETLLSSLALFWRRGAALSHLRWDKVRV